MYILYIIIYYISNYFQFNVVVCICHAWFVAPQIIPRHCHRLRPAPSFPLYLSRTTRQNDKYNQWNDCHSYFFRLVTGTVYTSRAKKSDRPPSPCGLHSLMTLDAVQPGSLIPAPSISSKLEVCNKESKSQPHKHTHKRWTGWMPWGCWKGSSLFAAKEHVLQYVPFQIVWICASSLFSQIALCCIFSQGQGGMQRIKCWERPQSLILRWSFQHAVLATDAELTPAMAMCLQFRVGHVFQSKQS